MNKLKYFIYICSINILFAGSGEASWINDWLLPSPALTYWTIVTFLVLLVVLRWKAWGPLMDTLDARAKQIEESLSKAEKVTAEAEQQAEKNEEILNTARKEAQEIVGQAREAAEKLKNKLESEGKDQYDAMLEKASIQIEAEKQKALSEIKNTVVDIAIKASEKVIKRNLNTDDNKKMIERTVDEFKKAN
jgi:F-type H+-transporting ATPase subunit b